MKNIYKVSFHPFFYITLFIVIVTGYFKQFLLFLFIILFHELGHILVGYIFKWKVKNIIILPFGAITVFDEGLTKPMIEELLIAIAGPIFQIIIYLLLKNRYDVREMHYSILFFNLFPIVPLDGSKILNILFNKFFSFKICYNLSIIVSIVFINIILLFFICYNKLNLILLLTILFLIVRVIIEIKNGKYIIHRFLYERYCYRKKYKKIKCIDGLDVTKIRRDYNYIFKYRNNCYTEHEILRKMFDFKGKL